MKQQDYIDKYIQPETVRKNMLPPTEVLDAVAEEMAKHGYNIPHYKDAFTIANIGFDKQYGWVVKGPRKWFTLYHINTYNSFKSFVFTIGIIDSAEKRFLKLVIISVQVKADRFAMVKPIVITKVQHDISSQAVFSAILQADNDAVASSLAGEKLKGILDI